MKPAKAITTVKPIRNTKILAKIADNRASTDFIKMVFDAGANVAWMNTAHQNEEDTLKVINTIRAISTKIPIAIDTKGPEIRTKDIEVPIEVKKGDHIIFTGDPQYKGKNIVLVSYPNFHREVSVGQVVLYDDASIEAVVIEKDSKGVKCVINNSGLLKSKKSLNIPNVHINLPALSEKDKGFINFCAKNNVDYITHSFVRGKEDIFEIKKITDKYPNYKPKIIAKIENREGFLNVKDILKYCDGIMVARGDLGAEVPIQELPYLQKKMLEVSLSMGKYSIVATQALESMIKNPRPTRAEVSDIGNAVLDGSGAMSMSGETAYGEYPKEATVMMGKVMEFTESKRDELIHFNSLPKANSGVFKIASDLIKKAQKAKVRAIFTFGVKIDVLKAISSLRSNVAVFSVLDDENDVRELGLAYGIHPISTNELNSKMSSLIGDVFAKGEKVVKFEVKGKKFNTSTVSVDTIK